ncbi:hypothetical protein AAFF_G00278930 [Aldrovandia affinis]|uniref:C2H2-type domain-containing protein n=1 Tax=Aldrovandia affinis TaxID=143900 RepID=A0AAD7SR15_9TELE|nr:hypothetical protein AAFF_G00278930 [Aldrovandia affinis]
MLDRATDELCVTSEAEVPSPRQQKKAMEFKWLTVSTVTSGGHLQCAFCRYQCKSNSTFQIHVGTSHPFHCEEMDVGRLGKIIFYQRSAKLFHCQQCFFTGKTYARVYDHVIVSHSFSGKTKAAAPALDAKPEDPAYLQSPAKFAALNSGKAEEEEPDDEDSRHSSSPGQSSKRKREAGSDEEQHLDVEDFSDYPAKHEGDEARAEKQAEETLLAKYIRRTGGRYYCNICNWRGKMKGFMFHHVSKKHNIPRPFACKECGKAFLVESMLLGHVSVFHKQGIYQCPYCSFKSNYLRGVRRHLNNCNPKRGEGPYDSDEQE